MRRSVCVFVRLASRAQMLVVFCVFACQCVRAYVRFACSAASRRPEGVADVCRRAGTVRWRSGGRGARLAPRIAPQLHPLLPAEEARGVVRVVHAQAQTCVGDLRRAGRGDRFRDRGAGGASV
eukprot:6207486-Pleurochrysis_carterae.AAC.1